jgi:uncharacterized membrane protein YeaQ/YmgE (transglycosylase-associated protein family)
MSIIWTIIIGFIAGIIAVHHAGRQRTVGFIPTTIPALSGLQRTLAKR